MLKSVHVKESCKCSTNSYRDRRCVSVIKILFVIVYAIQSYPNAIKRIVTSMPFYRASQQIKNLYYSYADA